MVDQRLSRRGRLYLRNLRDKIYYTSCLHMFYRDIDTRNSIRPAAVRKKGDKWFCLVAVHMADNYPLELITDETMSYFRGTCK